MEPKISDTSTPKLLMSFLWLISLLVVGFIGYTIGQAAKQPNLQTDKQVLNSLVSQAPVPPTAIASPSPQKNDTPACEKSGYAQKWEFLQPYTVKEKDTVQGIAETELGDASRSNEIMQINGLPLVAGSTIYLPPDIVTKSNGYLKQVQGKLIEKNASMWHVSFNNDEKGLGILIPSYWFKNISSKDMFVVGDCVTVLLDDGNTVFTVTKQ